jgi:hypothetical protein
MVTTSITSTIAVKEAYYMKSVFKPVTQVHDMEKYPCTLKLSDAVTMQAKVHYAHTGMQSDYAASDIVCTHTV